MKISKLVAAAGMILGLAGIAKADIVLHVHTNMQATGAVTVTSNPDRTTLLNAKVFWDAHANSAVVYFLTKDLSGHTSLYYTLHDFVGSKGNKNCKGSLPEATATDVPGTLVPINVDMTLTCN